MTMFAAIWKAFARLVEHKEFSAARDEAAGVASDDPVQKMMNRGKALLATNQVEEAITSYLDVVELQPDNVQAHVSLGYALSGLGRSVEARNHLERAVALDTNNADALYMLGSMARAAGEVERAVELLELAIQQQLEYEYVFVELAESYAVLGRYDRAISVMEAGIAKYPMQGDFFRVLADAQRKAGCDKKAEANYINAISLDPSLYAAHNDLGVLYLDRTEWHLAEEYFRRAIEKNPKLGNAYSNLGIALEKQGELLQAIQSYEKAFELFPDAYPVLNNLATAYRVMGRCKDSLALRRTQVARFPEDCNARENLLFELSYQQHTSSADYLAEAVAYGDLLTAQTNHGSLSWKDRDGSGRLRVGFLSGDFCYHPVGYFLDGVLSNFPRQDIDLIAFPTLSVEDQLTRQLRQRFSEWHCVAEMNDQEAARRVCEADIDILVDLSGHTKGNRLPVFAWRPAPVQITWLGFFASTGVAQIDYILSDRIAVPEEARAQFRERVWYLPDTRLCFSRPDIDVDVTPLPSLATGGVTFGCFQGLTKINDEVLGVWARILGRLPQSRLRIQSMYLGFDDMDRYLRDRLDKAGIDSRRVALHPSTSRAEYLAAHREIDILLDTFPYTGGTTTCEALWMGVPTVTLMGDTMLSRQGGSLLAYAGLTDWVAANKDEYVDIAVSRAQDFKGLAALRGVLRQQVATSPIFDSARFATGLAATLSDIWRYHQGG